MSSTAATRMAVGRIEPGPDPKREPRDWLQVRKEPPEAVEPRLELPYGTRVDLTRTEGGRDFFTIIDWNELAGRNASVRRKADGTSYLTVPPAMSGPATVIFDAGKGEAKVTSAAGRQVIAKAFSDPKIPDGTYDIWPRFPHQQAAAAELHLPLTPYALTWWIIGYQTQNGFHFHPGGRTAGCITAGPDANEIKKWTDIYDILIHARSADGRFSGRITISGHTAAGPGV